MTNHTPAPWLLKAEGTDTMCITDKDSRYVVASFRLPESIPMEEKVANAKLMRAAPAMKDALIAVVKYEGTFDTADQSVESATAYTATMKLVVDAIVLAGVEKIT